MNLTQKYQLQVLALGHWLNRLDYLMSPLSRLNLLYVVVKKILLQLWQLLTHLLRNAVFFTLLPQYYRVDARLTTLKHIIAIQEKKENSSELVLPSSYSTVLCAVFDVKSDRCQASGIIKICLRKTA